MTLVEHPLLSIPFQKITWDIMGTLPPLVKGKRYILVITDLFTKWVEAFPLQETSSETLASILLNEVICRFGTPKVLHSDQGRNLCSNLISPSCDLLGIHRTNTTAHHPQGNGQTYHCPILPWRILEEHGLGLNWSLRLKSGGRGTGEHHSDIVEGQAP